MAIRLLTYIFPARYYVALLQTVLLAGDVWAVILPNLAMLAVIATLLFALTRMGFQEAARLRRSMLASFFRIVALVRKELLAMLKDPRGRAVLFVPPALQCLVFGYVVNYDLNRVTYAAFDRDHSAASSELLASLDGSGVFYRVANLDRMAEVKELIDDRRVLLVVQIDQDFERRLLAGESASMCKSSLTRGIPTPPARP